MTKGELEKAHQRLIDKYVALKSERDELQDIVKELHDEIVAQDEEYKAMGEMCLKLGEENKKLREILKGLEFEEDSFIELLKK